MQVIKHIIKFTNRYVEIDWYASFDIFTMNRLI